MCDVGIPKTLRERVQIYINQAHKIKGDYETRMAALKEDATKDILSNCHIKVGDVYITHKNTAYGEKSIYYKVAKVDANIDGVVMVYGYKRKLDRMWGKRSDNFMFAACPADDYKANNNFSKIEGYVEPNDGVKQ